MTSNLSWLGPLGLVLDIIGALFIAWDVWAMSEREILASGSWQWGGGEDLLQNEGLREVEQRRRQRRLVRWGMGFLIAGFLFQLLGSSNAGPALRWTYDLAPGFWSMFWPIVVAAFLAIVAALPFARYLEVRLRTRQQWRVDLQRRQRGRTYIAIVDQALARNIETAKTLSSGIGARQLHHSPRLDSETWGAINAPVAELLNDDPKLVADLVIYFERISALRATNERFLDYFDGRSQVAEITKNTIVNRLSELSSEAEHQGTQLLERVRLKAKEFKEF